MPADEILTLELPASGEEFLWAALTAAGRNMTGAVRLVVLRGAGDDFFDGAAAAASQPTSAGRAGPDEALGWFRRPDLITVAAIRGRATGAGLDVAMACDLRVVAHDAELAPAVAASDPEGALGIEVETVVRLGELLGYARALEFLTTGSSLTGTAAAALGLASLAEASELDAAVHDLVAGVLARPRATVTMVKAVLAASHVDRRRTDDLAAGFRLAAKQT